MKKDEIERTIQNLRACPGADADERILADATAAFAQATKDISQRAIRPRGVDMIRRHMKGFIAASTAAAVVLVGMFLWMTAGTKPQMSAYAELAAAAKNSQAAEWVHERMSIDGMEYERWISFKPFRDFVKSNGGIAFTDMAAGKMYIYRFADKAITVDALKTQEAYDVDQTASSLMEMYDRIMKKAEVRGFEVKKSQETVDGIVYDAFRVAEEGSDAYMVVLVDPRQRRVAEVARFVKDGEPPASWKLVTTMDYPDKGPEDIYALGVPKDALIVTGCQEKVDAISEQAQKAIDAFAQNYYAIMCRSTVGPDGQTRPSMVVTVWKKNGRFRQDLRLVSMGQAVSDPDDVSSLESFAAAHAPFAVYLSDDKDTKMARWIHVGLDGEVSHGTGPLMVMQYTIEELTWGPQWVHEGISHRLRMLPNVTGDFGMLSDYEYIMDPRVVKGAIRNIPIRVVFRTNAQRDYAVELREQESDAHAPWVADKDWLKGVASGDKRLAQRVRLSKKIVEYGQLPGGQWYARRLKEEEKVNDSPRTVRLTTVHIDTAREIPDDLFDVAKFEAQYGNPAK